MNEDKIIEKILDNTARLDRIEEKMGKLDRLATAMDFVIGTLDEIKGMFKKQDTEQAATKHALSRHEKRIERLENKHGLAQA